MYEDDLILAIRDIAPRAPMPILLPPKRHVASALDLTDDDSAMVGRIFAVAADRRAFRGHRRRRLPPRVERRDWGGQSVDHLHVHLMGGRAFEWPPG